MSSLEILGVIIFLVISFIGHVVGNHNQHKQDWDDTLSIFNEESTRKLLPEYTDEEIEWCLEDNARFLSIDIDELRIKN